jgi:hypothetical protein
MSNICAGSAHTGLWAEASEIPCWGLVAKGLVGYVVVVAMGEGVD